MSANSKQSRLLVATRKGLFALARTNGAWDVESVSFLGDNVTRAFADTRDGTWYAALNLGHFGVKLRRSEDRGKSWQEIAVPEYAAEDKVATGDGKEPAPAKLQLLWELVAGGANEPGVLWAGTIPGGLFRSADRGASWQIVKGLWDRSERMQWFGGGYDAPGIHSVCVDPRDARTLRVAISCGGVWQSRDGGASWNVTTKGMFAAYMPPERREDPAIQDPHRMVQCAAAPDHLWIQHHNGVFRSTDGGMSWSEIQVPPSVFGFAVAVHPHDPQTAWFVPAVKDEKRVPVDGKLVVARTRDGGVSFDVLREGLPQRDAFDLVYRHGLAIDSSGERLAFGSTTGNLWLSDDAGENWQLINGNLPPIHAVNFE